MRKAERLRANPDQALKLLISGAPGIGKTSLVNLIARTLKLHKTVHSERRGGIRVHPGAPIHAGLHSKVPVPDVPAS
jgi:hypothetical protein